MGSEKTNFLKAVTVYHDSREQKNQHILDAFDALKVKHEQKKLDIADYSFSLAGRDFFLSCAIERKADPDELYSNIMEGPNGRKGERLEKELEAAYRILNDFTVLIEGVGGMEELRSYCIPEWKMKACPQRVEANIGPYCYERLSSWQSGNRYNFRIEFAKDPKQTAVKILERFYYYYRNYTMAVAPRH